MFFGFGLFGAVFSLLDRLGLKKQADNEPEKETVE